MTSRPLRDYVLVSKDAAQEKSAGGIFIAHAETNITTGTVLAVGTGKVASDGSVVPMEVVVGNKVLFNKNYATEVKVDNDTVLLLKEEQLMLIVS